MAGKSPYFNSAKKSSNLAADAIRKHSVRQRKKIKIEYESELPPAKLKKAGANANITKERSDKNIKQEYDDSIKIEYDNANIKKEHDDPNIKQEYDDASMVVNFKSSPKKLELTPVKKGKKLIKAEEEAVKEEKWEPKNWELVLARIQEMRKDRSAVVDTLGCERCFDTFESPEVMRFQTLVSLLLSAQTKDQVTFAAVERLKKHGLSAQNVCKMSEEKVGEIIHPVGFWKKKSVYLKQCAQICSDDYNGDIPSTLKGLMALPGVGPKMAHICMSAAWDELSGIGVDTHVHRIANRLGWTRKKTNLPDNTRKELESWLPRSEWRDINILLVGFGQQICLPLSPKCETCLINDICPSAFDPKNKRGSPKKKMKKER